MTSVQIKYDPKKFAYIVTMLQDLASSLLWGPIRTPLFQTAKNLLISNSKTIDLDMFTFQFTFHHNYTMCFLKLFLSGEGQGAMIMFTLIGTKCCSAVQND